MLHRCEELREITRRLANILPGDSGSRPILEPMPESGWSSQHTLIEARPVSVRRLKLEAAWRFKGDELPPLFQDMLSRRRYIQDHTRVSTNIDTPMEDGHSTPLPAGMSLWHAPEEGKRLMLLALQDARLLFQMSRDWIHTTVPSSLTHGTTTLFVNSEGPPEVCFRDSVRILRHLAPYVARLAEEYGKSISWIYGMGALEFEECCRLSVRWVQRGKGTPLELLPASACRYENGPVVHVCAGRSLIYHDLAPTLPDPSEPDGGPIRLALPEGVMLVLDGASRVRYAHGFPAWMDDGSFWLNLTFMLDCTAKSVPVAYEPETRAVIMRTPVVPERVVSTQILHSRGDPKPGLTLGRDCMSLTLGQLRRQIRSAESHVVSEKCLKRIAVTMGEENSWG